MPKTEYRKTGMIKLFRMITNSILIEAKSAVEMFMTVGPDHLSTFEDMVEFLNFCEAFKSGKLIFDGMVVKVAPIELTQYYLQNIINPPDTN